MTQFFSTRRLSDLNGRSVPQLGRQVSIGVGQLDDVTAWQGRPGVSTAAEDLAEVPDALFSEGTRSDSNPKRPTESAIAFADRVRQPYFERERRWYEDAFGHYPAGADRTSVV